MGGNKCMVLFCTSRGSIPGIKYFRLTASRRNSWLRVLGRDPNVEPLTESNRVCSLHFDDNDLVDINNRECLRPGAIPTKQLGIRRPFAFLQLVQAPSLSIHQEEEDSTTASCSYDIKSDEQNVVEEGLIYQFCEILLDDEENKEPYRSSPTSSTSSALSAASPQWTFDVHSILTIIYVYLGIFLLPSIQEETTPTVTQLKRKLQEVTSSSSDSDGLKGASKRARKDMKIRHTYSKKKDYLEEKLKAISLRKNVFREKLKDSKRKVKRLLKKVTSLKQNIFHLKNKNLLDDAAITVLE